MKMDNFETYLKKQATEIEQELISFVKDQPVNAATLSWDANHHLSKYVVGGKLARGSLVMLGFDVFSINLQLRSEAMKAALAVELAHSALLVHDDVMDQDEKRRGLTSIHKQHERLGAKLSAADSRLYGQAIAICIGDMLLFWAYQFLNAVKASSDLKQRLLTEFNRNMVDTVWGQIDDVNLAMLNVKPSKQDVLRVLLYKSGRYSLANPLMCGAILAGAAKEQLKHLEKFAQHLGVTFQIRDDELSLVGDESKTGKKVGNDISEDKQTLHRYFLFANADGEDKKQLEKIFGSQKISDQELKFVKESMKKYQVHQSVSQEVDQQLIKSKKALARLNLNSKNQALLQSLIDFINYREK